MKIGLFADSHYCTREILCGTRRPILSTQKLKEAVCEFKKQGVDLIICLGDLVDSDECAEKNEENLKLISSILNDSGIDCYCCMGNHDAFLFDKNEFSHITKMLLAPTIIQKNNKTLIFLDANYNIDSSLYKKGNVNWKETMIPKEQILELVKALNECDNQDVFIFTHQNLDPAVDTNHIIHNASEVREILKASSKVVAVYQGHYHPGASNIYDDIKYITLKAMCEGTENSFMIIDI